MNKAEAKRVQPTPGPWEISDKSPTLVVGYDPRLFPENERVTIAMVDPGGDKLDVEIGEANARLIAAAPDMLALLTALCHARVLGKCESLGRKTRKRFESEIDRIIESVGPVQINK